MTNSCRTSSKPPVREVRKPFLTGKAVDGNTLRNSLAFFGTLIVVFFVAFIACASATFGSIILRIALNLAVIFLILMIFYNNGAGKGAEAVTRGEILYQKEETGQTVSESERKAAYHPFKGFVTGLLGTIPFFFLAVVLALNTQLQMTQSGTLPSWMQAFTRRGDIGSALVHYTQPEGMALIDYIRIAVRICILPFVNIVSSGSKEGMLLLERLSPLILLLPAAAYGTGYRTGRKIRTRIHTAISENNRKRMRKERKKRSARTAARRNEPEKLN